MKRALLLSLLLITNTAFAVNGPMIERLGFKKTDRVLIIHADDAGLSNETNKGIEQVLKAGVVTSASIMIPAPKAKEAIEELKDWDVGLHLALNSEWKHYRWKPISKYKKVRSLTRPPFFTLPFLWNPKRYLFRSVIGSYLWAKDKHVEREIRAQIQQSIDWGLKPTHIDTHMGTVLAKLDWTKAYIRAARDFQLPMMLPKPSAHLERQVGKKQIKKLRPLLKQVKSWGFFMLDYLILSAGGGTYEHRKADYIKKIKGLKPGITQLICHPSLDFEGGMLPEGVQRRRLLDVEVLSDPEIMALIKSEGIKLTTWGEINKHYNWDQIPAVLDFEKEMSPEVPFKGWATDWE